MNLRTFATAVTLVTMFVAGGAFGQQVPAPDEMAPVSSYDNQITGPATMRVPVQRVAMLRPLTNEDNKAIAVYMRQHNDPKMTANDRLCLHEALKYLIGIDHTHVVNGKVEGSWSPNHFFSEYQSHTQLLNRVDWYVNLDTPRSLPPFMSAEPAGKVREIELEKPGLEQVVISDPAVTCLSEVSITSVGPVQLDPVTVPCGNISTPSATDLRKVEIYPSRPVCLKPLETACGNISDPKVEILKQVEYGTPEPVKLQGYRFTTGLTSITSPPPSQERCETAPAYYVPAPAAGATAFGRAGSRYDQPILGMTISRARYTERETPQPQPCPDGQPDPAQPAPGGGGAPTTPPMTEPPAGGVTDPPGNPTGGTVPPGGNNAPPPAAPGNPAIPGAPPPGPPAGPGPVTPLGW